MVPIMAKRGSATRAPLFIWFTIPILHTHATKITRTQECKIIFWSRIREPSSLENSMESPTFVSKHQLIDYVTKREFNDFVEEMRDFRDSTNKRLGNIDRRIDELKDEFRIHTGILMEQIREERQIFKEYIEHYFVKK